MLSLFRCLSRQTFNRFSSIAFSPESQSQQNYVQKRWHSRHSTNYNFFYGDNDSEEYKQNNEHNEHNDEKCNNNCNAFNFNDCKNKYNLLTSRLLETVGWLGAAIVVGLNVEKQIFFSIKSSKREFNLNCEECGPQSISTICGNCKYCTTFMLKLITFASPLKQNYVLKQIKSKELFPSHSIPIKSIESKNDVIDEICLELEKATIDYTESLNNMLGIALIAKDPEQAMKCWSNCNNNSKAIFNMGVAFETGKHSTDGTIDLMQAHKHYLISAKMGHKLAIYNLSLFYLYGKGEIEVDINRANKLLKRAAQLGVKQAKHFINKLNSDNDKIDKTNESIGRPVIKTCVSAPNLSDISHPYYAFNFQKSKVENTRNHSLTNIV